MIVTSEYVRTYDGQKYWPSVGKRACGNHGGAVVTVTELYIDGFVFVGHGATKIEANRLAAERARLR